MATAETYIPLFARVGDRVFANAGDPVVITTLDGRVEEFLLFGAVDDPSLLDADPDLAVRLTLWWERHHTRTTGDSTLVKKCFTK